MGPPRAEVETAGGRLVLPGLGGAAERLSPWSYPEHCEEPSPAAAPRWVTGRGRALILLVQTAGRGRRRHKLCISSVFPVGARLAWKVSV